METGTGKTYVYIETMYELMKAYGWSKYIVVVPSVAIREGVKKTFEVTADHFLQRYGQKARFFVYDSHDLTKLDDFATDAGLNVMIINMQAFNTSMKEDGRSKEARIIYSKQDDFGSRRPIDVIAAMNPIVIMDEPQKMSGPATKKGIQRFHPLFTLNYSATHKEKHDLVYVLDAVDAYQQRLVKQIEVKGFRLQNLSGTGGFVYLDDIGRSASLFLLHRAAPWSTRKLRCHVIIIKKGRRSASLFQFRYAAKVRRCCCPPSGSRKRRRKHRPPRSERYGPCRTDGRYRR